MVVAPPRGGAPAAAAPTRVHKVCGCGARPDPGQAHVVPQEAELVAARWMPLQEYATLQFLRQRPLHSMVLDRCLAYARGSYAGLHGFRAGGGLRLETELLLAGPLADESESVSRL